MTWEVFYDRFWGWADSTQLRNISVLTSFGTTDEICEVAESFSDEKGASRLIRKAVAAGVKFSAEEIASLEGIIEDTLYEDLIRQQSGAMNWDTFYKLFFDWSVDIQEQNALAQKDFGPTDELIEVIETLFEESVVTQVVKNALAAGLRFTSEEVCELSGYVSETLVPRLANTASTQFTEYELDEISVFLKDADIEAIAHKSGLVGYQKMEEEVLETPRRRGLGFFGVAFLILGLLGGRKKEDHKGGHSGHCDGNCAHCPAHYGYRYGRWYYGHHHHHGCQFGGNRGGGGMD